MSNLSRRSLVAGAASLPALAAGSAPAGTPVFLREDHAAVVARAEQVVELLRTCYLTDEGWQLDEQRAAAFLANIRRLDPEDGDALQPIVKWVSDHGQSLDWIFDGDPVTMICRGAARAADSTLVELARQFEQLQPKYLEALHHSDEEGEKAWDLAWQRVGGGDFKDRTREQGDAFFAGLPQAEIDTGADVVNKRYETMCEEIGTLARKIWNTPAHSMAGLRAKAMVAVHTNGGKVNGLWNETFSDLDWDKKGTRALIEAVCAVTGLEVPTEEAVS